MLKWLGAVLALGAGQGEGEEEKFDFRPFREIVILHEGRYKPLDTWAREVIHLISGKESFRGFREDDPKLFEDLRDPGQPRRVVVFPGSDPVENILRLISQPAMYRKRPFIKVYHPDVREKFGGDRSREYFSPDEIAERGAQLQAEVERIRAMADKDRGPYERSVGQLNSQYGHVRALFDEVMLRVVPLPYGDPDRRDDEKKWPSLPEMDLFLDGAIPADTTNPEARAFLQAMARADRSRLERVRALWGAVKEGLVAGRAAEFNRASAELRDLLRSLNPELYLSPEKVAVELHYNASRPFTKSYYFGFLPAMLLFLGAFIFRSGALRGLAIAAHLVGIGLGIYGYRLRWEIAERYPLSNMYESMIAMGMLLAIVGIVFELLYRSRVLGLCSAVIALLCMAAAENIPIFTPYVTQLPPSLLNQVIMTIHVPVIMAGYGGGLLCMGIGVGYILTWLFAPGRRETLEHLDLCLYRVLQVTVLLFIGGVALGAVWAGEAWGRYWGWDMKEVWALVSLLWYLAMLHLRMTGRVKGLLLSNMALIGFVIVLWSYLGVNLLFGKGLHTYGFVLGATWLPLLVITGLMGFFVVLSGIVYGARDGHGKTPGAQEYVG